MTRGLLDTSVVIAAGDERGLVAALPESSAISVATLAELHFGIGLAKSAAIRAARLQRLGAIEARFEALPLDADVARAYATMAHAVLAAGRKPRHRVMDLWIAATAQVHGLPIFTRNGDDFAGLDSLVRVHVV